MSDTKQKKQIALRMPEILYDTISLYKQYEASRGSELVRSLSSAKVLNAIIIAALDKSGKPQWGIDAFSLSSTPIPVRKRRHELRQLPNDYAFSFVADDETMSRLNRFVKWLNERSPVNIQMTVPLAIRTILAEALDDQGRPLWKENGIVQ